MLRIDAHQHFWKFDPVRDSWITDEMSIIKKDFLPKDLQALLLQNRFNGSVVVQSDQSEKENEFQLINAGKNDFIKGVVGWVDLQLYNIDERLSFYSAFRKMKGFRHVLQAEADRAMMLEPDFMKGISQLEKYGFTYDILVHDDQLKYIPEFVDAFPNQKFVVDHIAKPQIKKGEISNWKKEIKKVAACENVFCKISGMVTEADWKHWKREDLTPYIDVVVEAFGTKRIMYGSDWPVCLVAGSYENVLEVVQDYFTSFSKREQDLFFGGNAIRFYNL
ncbi:MAG TPA: amidohydrolase family protein [Chitinophagaceae bacterium]|nr:amidohydrolase family protein [Chitinophagaceae bacterium]